MPDEDGTNLYAREHSFMPAAPDPTKLTTDAVNQAVEVSRRETEALRGIIETRIDGMDKDRQRIWERLDELPKLYEVAAGHLRDEIVALAAHNREVITQRLNDLDVAAKVAAERIERIPAENAADAKALATDFKESMHSEREYLMSQMEVLQTKTADLDTAIKWRDEVAVRIRSELAENIAHLKAIHDKDLSNVEQQFRERDGRFDREATYAKDALAVALTSAKEQVALQTTADALAARKTEDSFTKQIDAIGARVDELKERISESSGRDVGAQQATTEHRLSQGAIVSLVIMSVGLIGLIVTVVTLIATHK